MANEVTFTMKEAKKLGIIHETLEGRMTVSKAANILHLSERQIYRLRAKVQEEGDQDIVHGLRGCSPATLCAKIP